MLAPRDELFFLIGADAFKDLSAWREWKEVAREVTFIVASRPGYLYDAPPEAKVETMNDLAVPVSSSAVRARLRAGEPSLDVPPQVIEYIRSHSLYPP